MTGAPTPRTPVWKRENLTLPPTDAGATFTLADIGSERAGTAVSAVRKAFEDTWGEVAVAPDPPAAAVLGVDPDASPAEIKKAYRKRVKEAHPDHDGSNEELQRVRDAKEAMLDG